MKRAALLLSMLFMLVGFSGCGSQNVDKDPPDDDSDLPQVQETQLLFDSKFAQGISVSALESQEVSYTWWKYSEHTRFSSGTMPLMAVTTNLSRSRVRNFFRWLLR